MKAVVLLSGGMDSAVCLAIAQSCDRDCTALFVDYEQAAEFTEFFAAKNIATRAGCELVIARARSAFDSGLHDTKPLDYGRDISQIGARGDRPSSYVPARNILLLSFALGLAETIGAGEIWFGANAGDAEGYPDCRPAFFNRFEMLSEFATRSAAVAIRLPLIAWNKTEVATRARDLGVAIEQTSSCYRGINCGACDACILRNHALKGIQ